MRNSFIQELVNIASDNENIFLLSADLGFGVLDKFWDKYPERFINTGISEQNMTSTAAGMALEGNQVFTYSIANFPTLRCLEQIRNDIAYHNANVKIVSVGAGFAYGSAGMSHHATEDLSVMRALPEMIIFSPSDPVEAKQVTILASKIDKPCYIRLGKGGEEVIHNNDFVMEIGKAYKVFGESNEIAIFSTGAITSEAIKAAKELLMKNIKVVVYSFPTVKPIDKELILKVANKASIIFTVEENNIMGGFGSAVAEVTSEYSTKARIIRIGLNDIYSSVVGTQEYLRDYYGLSSNKIMKRIFSEING